MSRRKLSGLLITIIIVVLFSLFGKDLPKDSLKSLELISPTPLALHSQENVVLGATDSGVIKETVKVVKIVDGDTIEIEGGKKVRYIGIDTPETKHPTKKVQCFGKEASAKNKELVEGKEVRLEKDVSETDRYGRLLRYVYIGDTMINELLVQDGYAVSSSYPPDIKHQELFRQTEREARENNRGLWNDCQ